MSNLLDHLKMQNKMAAFAMLVNTGKNEAALRLLDDHLAERTSEPTERLLDDVLAERERYDQPERERPVGFEGLSHAYSQTDSHPGEGADQRSEAVDAEGSRERRSRRLDGADSFARLSVVCDRSVDLRRSRLASRGVKGRGIAR